MLNFINIIACASRSPNCSDDVFPVHERGETPIEYFSRLLEYQGYNPSEIPALCDYLKCNIKEGVERKRLVDIRQPLLIDIELYDKYKSHCNRETKKIISNLYSDICKDKDKKPEDNHNKKLQHLISYIEDTYWGGNMPKNAKKAVLLMNIAIRNDKLFIYMISYSIFTTNGLKYLEKEGDENYKSRGVLHIRGKTNYRIAQKVTGYEFLNEPSKLGSYKKRAIIGSVAVYENIAKKTNITELTFEGSVRMMEPTGVLSDNHVSEGDENKGLLRLQVYNEVKKIMEEEFDSSSLDGIESAYFTERRQNSRTSSIMRGFCCFR